jgi:hypothetical protein
MKHYECAPNVWHEKTWVFDWDVDAGTVAGPDAAEILTAASWGGIGAHPAPAAHKFSPEPLKSKTDMAAIVGWRHVLPDDLAPFYPQFEDAQAESDVPLVF